MSCEWLDQWAAGARQSLLHTACRVDHVVHHMLPAGPCNHRDCGPSMLQSMAYQQADAPPVANPLLHPPAHLCTPPGDTASRTAKKPFMPCGQAKSCI